MTDEYVRKTLLRHPEVIEVGVEEIITLTLESPEAVTPSRPNVFRYYRMFRSTVYGDKYGRVVVKILPDEAFIIRPSNKTHYLNRKRAPMTMQPMARNA